eukprot:2906116-Ditylum_brightwellii.AAC.1
MNLSNKEDKKLFDAGTKGLSDDLNLTDKKERFNNFRNLVDKRIQKVRLIEALNVSTKWEVGVDTKNPMKVVNDFDKTGITKE